jgi:hypothetical protein
MWQGVVHRANSRTDYPDRSVGTTGESERDPGLVSLRRPSRVRTGAGRLDLTAVNTWRSPSDTISSMTQRRSTLAGLARRTRDTVWVRTFALLIGALLALVPVARAFCEIELPATSERTGTAHAPDPSPANEPFPDLCCVDLPSAIAADSCKCDAPAAGATRALDLPLVALSGALLSPPSPRFARTRLRLAAPSAERPFRRSMRLLI